ncbi:MAG: aldo/keto reductase [Desulfurococcales archaeon]|nr:aldo/keto reductase [Desulfurococcales archaeon]
MRYKILGRGGPRVSVLGLGLWQAGSRMWSWRSGVEDNVRRALGYAIAYGINFLDTAEIYGAGYSERILGRILSDLWDADLIIASKLAGYRWTMGSLRRGVEGINRRLGRTVDLIQHHWPPPAYVGVCRVVRGLERVVKEGLAHYYGLSNYPARLLEKALECTKSVEPVSNQIQYSLAYRAPEASLIPVMREAGLSVIAWSPLAKGALAGARGARAMAQRLDPVFRRASRDRVLLDAVRRVAERRRATMAQVALAWLMHKGAIPIPGFRRVERVKEYVGAVDLVLTASDLDELDRASAKYVNRGVYTPLQGMRLLPGLVQMLMIKMMGGV